MPRPTRQCCLSLLSCTGCILLPISLTSKVFSSSIQAGTGSIWGWRIFFRLRRPGAHMPKECIMIFAEAGLESGSKRYHGSNGSLIWRMLFCAQKDICSSASSSEIMNFSKLLIRDQCLWPLSCVKTYLNTSNCEALVYGRANWVSSSIRRVSTCKTSVTFLLYRL